MIKSIYLFLIASCLISIDSFAQKIISGTVNAEDGNSLPGVAVTVKNTTQGTITDASGNYSLSIPGNDDIMLVFSYVGYQSQEIQVGDKSVIDIQLQEQIKNLNEVVVIAYGETDRKKFTGSLTSVDGEAINQIPQTSAIQMLQGRSAGVNVLDGSGQPGSVGSIVIRGVGTITGNTSPLYVIDGIATNSIATLNPNDIASISVLKDAAATSIYGSRAANGVVLITTKSGKSGETTLSLNVQAGFSDLENPNDFRVMNASEYIDYYREAISNGGVDPDDPTTGFYLPATEDTINTNWLDEILQTGSFQQYELSMSGGNEKTVFFSSLNYLDQEGNVLGTDFTRYSGRVNLKHSASENLNIDFKLFGSYAEQNLRNSIGGRSDQFAGAHQVSPLSPIFANENTVLNGLGYNFDLPSNAQHNPLAAAIINRNLQNSVRVFPTLRVTFEPFDNFSIWTSGSLDWTYRTFSDYTSKFYLAETEGGESVLEFGTSLDANFNLVGDYSFDLGTDHTINALVGFEAYKRTLTDSEAGTLNFAFNSVNDFGSGAVTNAGAVNYFFEGESLASVFTRIDYSFKDKLFLDASLRRDGSSKYGPENRWGTFYAFGAGYSIIQEAFLQPLAFLSDLRVRSSYGISGNPFGTSSFAWRQLYSAGGAYNLPGGPNPGSSPESPGNPFLKWEQSEQFNVGLDFGLFNNRISGSIEYYSRNSIDLVTARPISQTSGFSEIEDNIGEVRNSGIELVLRTSNIITEDFRWYTDFNYSNNNNEVLSINGETDTLIISSTNAHIVGQELGQWYMPAFVGVDPGNGNPLYQTTEGAPTVNYASASIAGRGSIATNPDFFGAITNTFEYKGFSVSAMLYFIYGTQIYRSLEQDLSTNGGQFPANQSSSLLQRWQEPGDFTSVPRADINYVDPGPSSRWLEDGSYIRLRNVSIAYSVPNTLSNKIGLSDLRISARGVNVLTFTAFNGYNVDTGSFTDDDYPNTRNITFGIDAKF